MALLALVSCKRAPKPYGATPTPQQVEWQKMETNMFFHFGPNTFTGREWGEGTEAEDIFNPSQLNCRQWVKIAKAAGFKGVIITAKHHDGFCLWPNPVTTHSVASSPWKKGKGDILKELSAACKAEGLKFGIYISPWDRNDPRYGTPEYNEVFRQTLHSALSSYGPVFEQWFDGACGEGPSGKRQEYDWDLYHSEVFSNQKKAIVFSNVGPGCRWVGNEEGQAGRTCWSTFSPDDHGATHSALPGDYGKYLNEGDPDGALWIPAETDVSIRPGWFWRESENGRVKGLQDLLQIYYESVGRNSLMLLNVPPDTRGLIHSVDSSRLMEFRAALDEIFANDLCEGAEASGRRWGKKCDASNVLSPKYDRYWIAPRGQHEGEITITFDGEKTFNRVMLQEYIPMGQRISSFEIEVKTSDGWETVAEETTVGYKRLVIIPEVTASQMRIRITGALAEPTLTKVATYLDLIYRPVKAQRENGTVMGKENMLIIDYNQVQDFTGFQYTPMYRGEGGVIVRFRLETSDDGLNWTVLRQDARFDNIVNNPIRTEVRIPFRGRFIKLVPLETSNGSTYGLSDFGAFR